MIDTYHLIQLGEEDTYLVSLEPYELEDRASTLSGRKNRGNLRFAKRVGVHEFETDDRQVYTAVSTGWTTRAWMEFTIQGELMFDAYETLDRLSTEQVEQNNSVLLSKYFCRFKSRHPDPGVCKVVSIDFDKQVLSCTNGICVYYPSFGSILLCDQQGRLLI